MMELVVEWSSMDLVRVLRKRSSIIFFGHWMCCTDIGARGLPTTVVKRHFFAPEQN